MAITGPELEVIVDSLLTEGVPTTVIARVFDLDLDLLRNALSQNRIKRYGTDDMTEYMEILQWETVDEALQTVRSGSSAEKNRIFTMLLGKQMALSARRTPEGVRNSQEAVIDLLESMKSGNAPAPSGQSKFVARQSDGSGDA